MDVMPEAWCPEHGWMWIGVDVRSRVVKMWMRQPHSENHRVVEVCDCG